MELSIEKIEDTIGEYFDGMEYEDVANVKLWKNSLAEVIWQLIKGVE